MREVAATRQIEWYLSMHNFPTDYYLHQHLHAAYWVDLAVLCSFPKMLQIGISDERHLASALAKHSTDIETRPTPGLQEDLARFQVRSTYLAQLDEATRVLGADPERSALEAEKLATPGVEALLIMRDDRDQPQEKDVAELLAAAPHQHPHLDMSWDADTSHWVVAFATPEAAAATLAYVQTRTIGAQPVAAKTKLPLPPPPMGLIPGPLYYPDAYPWVQQPQQTRRGYPSSGAARKGVSPYGYNRASTRSKGDSPSKAGPPRGQGARAQARDPAGAAHVRVDGNSRWSKAKAVRGSQGQLRYPKGSKGGAREGKEDGRGKDKKKSAGEKAAANIPAPELTEVQFPPLGGKAVDHTGPGASTSAERTVVEDQETFAAEVVAAVEAVQLANSEEEKRGGEAPSPNADNDGLCRNSDSNGDGAQSSITSSLTPSPTPSERIERDSEEVSITTTVSEPDSLPRTAVEQPANTTAQGSYAAALLSSKSTATASATSSGAALTEAGPPSSPIPDKAGKASPAASPEKPMVVPAEAKLRSSVWTQKPSSVLQAPLVPVQAARRAAAAVEKPGSAENNQQKADYENPSGKQRRSDRPTAAVRENRKPAKESQDTEKQANDESIRAPSPPPPVLTGAWAKGTILSALTADSPAKSTNPDA